MGWLKYIVFQTQPTIREDMENNIRHAIRNLARAKIEAAVLSTQEKCQQCIEHANWSFPGAQVT